MSLGLEIMVEKYVQEQDMRHFYVTEYRFVRKTVHYNLNISFYNFLM